MSPIRAPLSANTQAILLLTAPLLAGRESSSGDLLSPGEYKRLVRRLMEQQRQPADFLSPDAGDLIDSCRLVVETTRLKNLLARGFLLSQVVERWRTRAIWVVSRADANYPKRLKMRLKDDAPAVLYGCGDTDLLDVGGLAVVGSRNVDDGLVEYTEGIGRLTAKARRMLISGGARGIDQAAMRGALGAGGHVAGVLADSLEKAAMNREHRQLLMEGQLVLVSPYDPSAGFNVGNAMQRNKLIYALADAALVVNSDVNKGGTWAGAVEQLDKLRFVPIYVRTNGELGKGLGALQEHGALPWPNPEDRDGFDAALNIATSAYPVASSQTDFLSLTAREPDAPIVTEIVADVTDEDEHPVVDERVPNKNLISTPAEDLFNAVRKILTRFLMTPKKEAEVATELNVSTGQAREWLQRLVVEGTLEKRAKPITYVVKQAELFEQSST